MRKGMNGPQAAQENEQQWNQWLKDVADGAKQWPMKDGKVIRSQLATDANTGLSRNVLYGRLRHTVDTEIDRVEEQERLRREAQKHMDSPDNDGPSAINYCPLPPSDSQRASETDRATESRAIARLREDLAREQRSNDKLRQLLSEARAAERKAQAENEQYRHELESATTAHRWWTGQGQQEN